MILEEVEHVAVDVIYALPSSRDAGSRVATHHRTDGVVESHLVVEIVEVTTIQVVAILVRIIHLSNEDDVGVFGLHNRDDPSPEVARHHLSHIATETVNALRSPEQEDVAHLFPSVGCRRTEDETFASAQIVSAVVQLDCLVPIVLTHPGREAVVARHLAGLLHVVTHLIVVQREVGRELRAWQVIEIVVGAEGFSFVVIFTQVTHSLWFGIRVVLTCHVVGHKVDNHLQVSLVGSHNEVLKLLHAFRHLRGEVGIDVVVVLDGIRTSCDTLHNGRVVALDAILRVIALGGMLDETCVPDVCGT